MKQTLVKSIIVSLIAIAILLFAANDSRASEGTIEMRSTTKETYRCWASSLFMPNNRYKVSVGCVDLVYPPKPPELYKFYILWANPIDKSNSIRLGSLGGGKANFDVAKPFNELFVTLEESDFPRRPSNQVVMRGNVSPITFLLRPTTPTPTPTTEVSKITPTIGKESTVDTSQMSTREKLALALKRAGIASVAAFVVIIGLVFVISRSKG
jgi:hypothetical protein